MKLLACAGFNGDDYHRDLGDSDWTFDYLFGHVAAGLASLAAPGRVRIDIFLAFSRTRRILKPGNERGRAAILKGPRGLDGSRNRF